MNAAARIARRCDPIRFLLLHGVEWTDANPWFGFAGLAVTVVLAGVLDGLLP